MASAAQSSRTATGKGDRSIWRNGPKRASHKIDLSLPFAQTCPGELRVCEQAEGQLPPGRDTISAGEIVQHQVNFVEADMREVPTAWGKSQAASAVAIRVPAKSKDPEARADCRRDVPSAQPILAREPG